MERGYKPGGCPNVWGTVHMAHFAHPVHVFLQKITRFTFTLGIWYRWHLRQLGQLYSQWHLKLACTWDSFRSVQAIAPDIAGTWDSLLCIGNGTWWQLALYSHWSMRWWHLTQLSQFSQWHLRWFATMTACPDHTRDSLPLLHLRWIALLVPRTACPVLLMAPKMVRTCSSKPLQGVLGAYYIKTARHRCGTGGASRTPEWPHGF